MVGLIPLCENMPSGSAIKPGDVVTAMNGKTIEVGMGYIHVVSILHVHCTCCVYMGACNYVITQLASIFPYV